jgi:hypothetical protein
MNRSLLFFWRREKKFFLKLLLLSIVTEVIFLIALGFFYRDYGFFYINLETRCGNEFCDTYSKYEYGWDKHLRISTDNPLIRLPDNVLQRKLCAVIYPTNPLVASGTIIFDNDQGIIISSQKNCIPVPYCEDNGKVCAPKDKSVSVKLTDEGDILRDGIVMENFCKNPEVENLTISDSRLDQFGFQVALTIEIGWVAKVIIYFLSLGIGYKTLEIAAAIVRFLTSNKWPWENK